MVDSLRGNRRLVAEKDGLRDALSEGAWSLRTRDFAMLELGGDAGLARVSARSTEEAYTCLFLPH